MQACHAVAELVGRDAARFEGTKRWLEEDKTIVCYQVPDAASLLTVAVGFPLTDKVRWSLFEEPDLDNEATAIAIGPLSDEFAASLFKGFDLKLLS